MSTFVKNVVAIAGWAAVGVVGAWLLFSADDVIWLCWPESELQTAAVATEPIECEAIMLNDTKRLCSLEFPSEPIECELVASVSSSFWDGIARWLESAGDDLDNGS